MSDEKDPKPEEEKEPSLKAAPDPPPEDAPTDDPPAEEEAPKAPPMPEIETAVIMARIAGTGSVIVLDKIDGLPMNRKATLSDINQMAHQVSTDCNSAESAKALARLMDGRVANLKKKQGEKSIITPRDFRGPGGTG